MQTGYCRARVLYGSFFIFPALYMPAAHSETGWPEQVTVSGMVETALGGSTDYNDDTGSGIEVPTVELAFDAAISPRVNASLGFKYEEGQTDFGIDTAFISYQIDRLTMTMGQVYLPFGTYESLQISGTLPSEMGEARHSVGMVTYETGLFTSSAYIFNGAEDKPDTEDVLSVWGGKSVSGDRSGWCRCGLRY